MSTIAQKQKLVKANAANLGLTVAAIGKLTEAELDARIASLEVTSSGEADASNAFDGIDTGVVTTKSGEQVAVITARFVDKTTASSVFEMSNGKRIYCNNPRLATLVRAGKIAVGTEFGFKPDTLVWNEARGTYYGDLNQAFNAELFGMFNEHAENLKAHFAERVDQLIVGGGYTPAEARAKAQAERDASMPAPKPLPTLSL